MAVEAQLKLQISDFERKYRQAKEIAKRDSAEMRKAAEGVKGASLADGFKNLIPAVSIAALGAGIKSALQRADDLADIKVALGETAETLQRVDYAAQQAASVGVDQLARSIIKLEQNLGNVENKAAAEALGNFGVTAGQLAAMPLDEKILALSGAFQQARAQGTGVKDIMDLLGRSGAELIPMLGQSKEALEAMFADAPVVTDELIDRMAILNDQFDGLVMKAKTSGVGVVGALSEVGTFLADLVAEGSLEKAFLNFDDRQVEALRNIASQKEAKQIQAEAMDSARAAQEEAAAREKGAEAAKKAGEEIAKSKEAIEKIEFDLLPDDQKVDALKAKLKGLMDSTVGMFSLKYETTPEGLEKLAKDREQNKDLPASGQNSAAEAFAWLAEQRALAAEIAKVEEKIIADQKKASDEDAARQKEIADLRASIAKSEFEQMSPMDKAREMRAQLGESLGIDINGLADIEKGMRLTRMEADSARRSGDVDGEKAALERLSLAQEQADRLKQITAGVSQGPVGGALQSVVDQIFNRDPAAEQLRAMEEATRETRESRITLDKILEAMGKPVPRDYFSDFGG